MYSTLEKRLQQLTGEQLQVDEARLQTLNKLITHLQQKRQAKLPLLLNFICTHNSRRSHLAQAWAYAWGKYYHIDQLELYSGGTEATAFHDNSVRALRADGFEIVAQDNSRNPKFRLKTGDLDSGLLMYSKKFDVADNPSANFVAILVCSDADEACPFVPGGELRITLPFEDPKIWDNTDQAAASYLNRSREIAREIGYVLCKVAKV